MRARKRERPALCAGSTTKHSLLKPIALCALRHRSWAGYKPRAVDKCPLTRRGARHHYAVTVRHLRRAGQTLRQRLARVRASPG